MVVNLKKTIIAGVFLAYAAGAGATAQAHTFWANATEYSPTLMREYGRTSKVFLGWGHRFPVDDFIRADDLEEYSLIAPDGTKQAIGASPGEFMAAELKFSAPGAYYVSAVRKPGYYTVYKENGKSHHVAEPKNGRANVVLSLYHQQHAKALITVDGASVADVSRVLGHKIEIIPLENPSNLNGEAGRVLPVKVLFEGKPLKNCRVYATYQGFSEGEDYAVTTQTDEEGIAKIKLTHLGKWRVKASVRNPAPVDMQDQFNQTNYTATLTFRIR